MYRDKSFSPNSITILGENEDGYDVLITCIDQETGKIMEYKDSIKQETFDSGVRLGYLKKVES